MTEEYNPIEGERMNEFMKVQCDKFISDLQYELVAAMVNMVREYAKKNPLGAYVLSEPEELDLDDVFHEAITSALSRPFMEIEEAMEHSGSSAEFAESKLTKRRKQIDTAAFRSRMQAMETESFLRSLPQIRKQ